MTRDIAGALSDYAGNHGDLSPGATGAPTDFYYGGNGTGVIISVRPSCKSDKAIAPLDRIRMASVRDGTSNTFLFGEKFVSLDGLAQFPKIHRPTTAITYPHPAAWLAQDFDWQTGQATCWPTCFRLEVGIRQVFTSRSWMAAFDYSVPRRTPRFWDRSRIVDARVVELEH